MAAKELAAYVHDQLAGLPGVRSIPMMGGYIFYYQERIFGGIYGPGMMIKDTPAARAAMPESEPMPPYSGAKGMLPCTVLDDREAFQGMVRAMFDELPPPKSRKRKEKS